MEFTDGDSRWEVLAAHARTGLARGEKVMFILDPDDLTDDDAVARLDGGAGQATDAWRSGRLELGRSTPFYLPDGRFDRDRQIRCVLAEVERCRNEGYPGLRAAAGMSWAARAGIDEDVLVGYERSLEPLFEPLLADPRLVTICYYDRRLFSDRLVATMRKIHPLQVMEHLDAFEVSPASAGMRLAGSAELDDGPGFSHALYEARDALRLEIDLGDVVYMEAAFAQQLIDFAAALPAEHEVVVRCGLMHEMALQALGSDDVPQLVLRVDDTGDVI
jgi:hypothetical protein